MDVAAELDQVDVVLHQQRLVAALEKVTDATVVAVERLREAPVEVVHGARQVGLKGLNEQMVVVVHQEISMQQEVKVRHDIVEDGDKPFAIVVGTVDRLAFVATCGDVIEGASELNA